MPPSIFISYRRSDSGDRAWQIHRDLSGIFGNDEVFLDIEDNTAGDDFPSTQLDLVRSAKVVLVLIGKDWLDARDASGRRLENPNDNVRREIETALRTHGVSTIPVFLASGTGVTRERLPVGMQDLVNKHGPHVRPKDDYERDMVKLIDAVKDIVPPRGPPLARTQDLRDDLKNVIVDLRTSAELLRGTPPSLLQCVEASRTCYLPFAEKSRPVSSDFLYNHFWGPSVILMGKQTPSSPPRLLWHQRAPRPDEPANVLRRGQSILLHASYQFHVTRELYPMDAWITKANRESVAASSEFTSVPDGVLFKLLDYKITCSDITGDCRPFAVITRDLRKSEGRVYTQYVFLASVCVADRSDSEDLHHLRSKMVMQNDGQLRQAPADITPDFFLRKDPSPKVMDYLALRGLIGEENSVEAEGGRFVRDFDLV